MNTKKIKDFVEVKLVEKVKVDKLSCSNGCQRSQGSPTGS